MSQQLGLQLEDVASTPRRRQRRAYHVRSHATLPEAQAGEKRAHRQEDHVLAWFRAHPGRWTPWDVAEALGICINSARRSCTNLTYRGLLVHQRADRRPAGPYGQRSGTWEVA
jgi:hypothetical protein